MTYLTISAKGTPFSIQADKPDPQSQSGYYYIIERYLPFLRPKPSKELVKSFLSKRLVELNKKGVTKHEEVADKILKRRESSPTLITEKNRDWIQFKQELEEWTVKCPIYASVLFERLKPILPHFTHSLDMEELKKKLISEIQKKTPTTRGQFDLHDHTLNLLSKELGTHSIELIEAIQLYEMLLEAFPDKEKGEIHTLFNLIRTQFDTPLKETLKSTLFHEKFGHKGFFQLRKQLINSLKLEKSRGDDHSIIKDYLLEITPFLVLNKEQLTLTLSDEEMNREFQEKGLCMGIVLNHLRETVLGRKNVFQALPFDLSEPSYINPLAQTETFSPITVYFF